VVLRIFQMIATSGFLTALECTKFVFGQGSAPYPTGRAYSAPKHPLAGIRDLLIRGREKQERKMGREEGVKVRDGPPFRKFLNPRLYIARSLTQIKRWAEYQN